MNIQETALVVGKIAVYDKRQMTEETVLAIHQAIGDLDYHDCLDAVVLHFRESSVYLMPHHIRENVRRIRADRAALENRTLDQTTCPHKFIGRDRDCVICGLIPSDAEYDTWRELVAS